MDTVADFIGPPKDPNIGQALSQCKGKSRAVGIELELENVKGYEVPSSENTYNLLHAAAGWAVKRDNSLRNNGVEFISMPSEAENITEKTLLLFAQAGSKSWKTSSRTGLHVHVNVRDFTWPDIRALAATYCLLEPALFAWVGKEREENIFCVPYYRTPKSVMGFASLQNDVSIAEGIGNLHQHWCKYTALHLAPIYKLGSVEFRHAPSWVEPYRIASWARLCEKIVSYAKGKTAKQVVAAWDSDWFGFMSQFTFVPNYFETVQKLDSDFLANTIAGIEVSPDAWNPSSVSWEDEWKSMVVSKKIFKPFSKPSQEIPPLSFDEVTVAPNSLPVLKTAEWPVVKVAKSTPTAMYHPLYNTPLTKEELLKSFKAPVYQETLSKLLKPKKGS